MYADCNAADRMEKWRASGGTLNNNRNIGCGINTLTFLGVFDRATGQRMVTALASDPASTGTSFLDIMRYVTRHAGLAQRGERINELAGYINTTVLLREFISWIDAALPINACTIIKTNRDLAGELPGHSFVISKDSAGTMYVVDPQTMHVHKLASRDDTLSLFKFVDRNQFLTASVIVYLPGAESSYSAQPPVNGPRRRVRAPLKARSGPDIRENPVVPRLAVPDKDIQALAKKGEDVDQGKSPTGPPLVLETMATLSDLNDDRLLVLKHMPDARLMSRQLVSPIAPVLTVPFSAKQADEWVQEPCTSDTACVNHAMSILRVLPREQYRELVRVQNETATGVGSREIDNILHRVLPRRVKYTQSQTFAVPNAEAWKDVFERIPIGEGTIGKLYRNSAMGHVVVLAHMLPGSAQIPAGPVLLDGSTRKWYQINQLEAFMTDGDFLPEVGLIMHPPRFEYRGTKRKRNVLPTKKGPSSKSRSARSKSKSKSRSPSRKRQRTAPLQMPVPGAFHVGATKRVSKTTAARRQRAIATRRRAHARNTRINYEPMEVE